MYPPKSVCKRIKLKDFFKGNIVHVCIVYSAEKMKPSKSRTCILISLVIKEKCGFTQSMKISDHFVAKRGKNVVF